MSENEAMECNWDEVDDQIEETVSKEDQEKADSIADMMPVGKFLVEVVESKAIEKTLSKYSCLAAKLRFKIHGVIQLEQPVMIEGKQLNINGIDQFVVKPVEEKDKKKYNKMYVGNTKITDEINLYSPSEKQGMKDRRIFIATRLGIIEGGNLNNSSWANAVGKFVIISTERNKWTDKKTGEPRENVRVGFTGYEYPKIQEKQQVQEEEVDLSDI